MKWICILAAGLSGALAQTAPPPPAGSIEGQIVSAATGAPLKKAAVRLVGNFPQFQSANGGRGLPPVSMARTTDDQGRYKFTGLQAGRYTISASRTGFLQQGYGSRRSGFGGTPIFLGDNQQARGIDLKMTPQAVITGRVLDEDGDPLPNFSVRLMKQVWASGGTKQWQQRNAAQSSDIGEYRLADLEPGHYLVATMVQLPQPTTEFPNKPEMIYAATFYPRSLDELSASPIDVGAGGEIRGIDIHVLRVPAVRVRGTVANAADANGRGRGGVQLGLVPRDGGAAAIRSGSFRPDTGAFEIRGVQPGSYLLWARWNASNVEMFTSQPLDVAGSAVDGIALTLAPALDIPVRLTVAESDAQVDLSRVLVRLRPLTPGLNGAAPMARSENGQFTLRGVTPLRYAVTIGGMPQGCYLQSLRYGGQEVKADGVEFTSRSPLEVVLSSQAAQITGAVTDKDSHPVMRAVVVLIPNDASLGDLQSETTDDNGAFTFDRLHPGRYRVLAWEDTEPGAYLNPEFRKIYEGRATDVNVAPRDQQKVQLRAIAVDEMK